MRVQSMRTSLKTVSQPNAFTYLELHTWHQNLKGEIKFGYPKYLAMQNFGLGGGTTTLNSEFEYI